MGEKEVKEEEITKKILTNLKFKRQGMTISELARKLKINRNSMAKYLQLLLVSGQVEIQVVGNAKIYTVSRRLPISTVLSFSSDFVVILDSDARIATINEPFLVYCGKEKVDIVGKTIQEAQLQLLSSPAVSERIKEGLQGEKSTFEITQKEIDDEHIYRVRFIPTALESGSKGLAIFLKNLTEERRAEKAIRLSEERFRSMADLAPFPLTLIDSNGKYCYLNEKFVEMFGYTLEDIPTGKDWFERAFPDPEFRKKVIDCWKSDLKNAPPGAVRQKLLPVTCKDGTMKEILFQPVTLNDGNQFVIYEDITEKGAGARNQALLAAIVESSDDAIIGMDNAGMIISWNRGAEQIYGYSAAEIIGKSFLRIVPEEQRQEQEVINTQVEKGKPVQNFEMQHLTRDGMHIDVSLSIAPLFDEAGKVFGASVITRDITEKKQVETALQQSELMYRTIFNSKGTGMLIIEEDSTISLMNAQMERISGYSRSEIEGKRKWHEFVAEEDRKRMLEFHNRRIQDPATAPVEYEFSFRNKGGDIVIGLLFASIIPNSRRTIISIIDITRRKLVEKTLQELNEELNKKMWDHTRDLIKSNEFLNIEITAKKHVEKLFKKQQAITIQCLNLMGITIVTLDQDGKILTVNDKGLQNLGYREEEIIGKNWFENFITEKEKEKASRMHRRVAKSGINSNIRIISIITKTGMENELVWLAICDMDENNHLSSVLWLGENAPGKTLVTLSQYLI